MALTFPVRVRLIGSEPPPPAPLFVAPRPLHGDPVDLDVTGFVVHLPPGTYRLLDQLDANRRLDAHLLVSVPRSHAIAEGAAAIRAEYGVTSDVDDDMTIDYWSRHCAPRCAITHDGVTWTLSRDLP